jgi:hypothetical protein
LSHHHHAVCNFSCTRVCQVTSALHLDHTDAAAFPGIPWQGIFDSAFSLKNCLNGGTIFDRRQIRMVTQAGNINARLASGFQDGRPGRYLNPLSIYDHRYSIHIQISLEFRTCKIWESGSNKQMTENRKQKSDELSDFPAFDICLLSSDI